jgi:hypothetical protein
VVIGPVRRSIPCHATSPMANASTITRSSVTSWPAPMR